MESSDSRRPSDSLPSISYLEFERQAKEGIQFQQRHMARTSISAASPISPTTIFGPPPSHHQSIYPQASSNGTSNGYISPPDSRRTSGNNNSDEADPMGSHGRQSLPSLHEALADRMEKPVSFSAPSPMQTPPIGSGSFSNGSFTSSMPRSQPSEPLATVQSQSSQSSQTYPSSISHVTSGPPAPVHTHESVYARRDSQEHTHSLRQNPYSQVPISVPSLHQLESSYPPPPPPPNQNSYPSHPYTVPHVGSVPRAASSPSYPPTPSYPNNSNSSQYPFPPHASAPPPPHSPYHTGQSTPSSSSYPYSTREAGYPAHDNIGPPQTSPGLKSGVKRNSGYGSAIERALSISAIRRDLEAIKDHSARIYHIVEQYQQISQGSIQTQPGGLDSSLRDFTEALQRSYRTSEALQSCQRVFEDLSAKEYAEQNAQKFHATRPVEYNREDIHFSEDVRSNGAGPPDAKKVRRGRAAPPGRCHSCHRAETPEWRRGPDGARTLCNACGLHYAKLTRKLSKASMGVSSLARKGSNTPLP